MEPDVETFVPFALELASRARIETMRRPTTAAEDKGGADGFDPVTEADRAAETAIREAISVRFPDHGVHGEEFADRAGSSEWTWSIDPIDGTRAYICDLPCWTTLIALLGATGPALGIIDAPRLDELYWGSAAGSFLETGGARTLLRTSGCTHVTNARLSTTDPYLFRGAEYEAFTRVRTAALTTRYGLDAYAYARLAAGSIDLVIESGLQPHDYNALIPVVRGAGGIFADWDGSDDFHGGRVIAAATSALFDEAMTLLRG